jgi:hypothetical protein
MARALSSRLKGAKSELRDLKTRSMLLGACTSCPLLRSDLEESTVEIKDRKHTLDHSSRYSVLSPPCEACDSLKGDFFHATKENCELQHEVTYLTAHLEKTKLSEKMIEDDLNWVEESATKFTYKLGVGFERYKKNGEKSAPKFVPSSKYHKEEEALKPTKTYYPSNLKPPFNPKRDVKKETPSRERKLSFACFVAMLVTWTSFASDARELTRDTLSFEYARNSYRDEFFDFLPHSYSHALSRFSHGPNHHSYGFGS